MDGACSECGTGRNCIQEFGRRACRKFGNYDLKPENALILLR